MKINNKIKIIGFSLSAILIIIDQVIKMLAEIFLKPEGFVKFLDPIINLSWQTNYGAAWGAFADNKFILIGLTALILLAVCCLILFDKLTDKFMVICACVVVAGGLGNLIDRIFTGFVIDYLKFGFFEFPVFNFADMCVTIGAIAFAVYYLFFYKTQPKLKPSQKNIESEPKA